MVDEGFVAHPDQIAGLGVLALRISVDTLACSRFIGDHAGFDDGVQGRILQRLAPFIATYQESTRSRQVHLAANCGRIGDELRRAAWLYFDQENENYDALDAHTTMLPLPTAGPRGSAEIGRVDEFEGAADYGAPEGIEYPPPNPAVDDTRDAIDEAAGWLGEIDRTIYELTEWSPLNEATMPISGNWNEIGRLGHAFAIAGDAMEAAAESFDRGIRRVDQYWKGAAAQAFSDYSSRQLDAMYWEGPAGRTIAEVCNAIADQLRSAVQTVITKIVELLEAEIELDTGRGALKFLIKKIPVIGTAWQVENVIEIIWKAMDLTMELVDKIEKVVDDFGRFLDAIIDPAGYVDRTVEQTLQPINDMVERADIANDAARTADVRALVDTPVEAFSVGVGSAPWEGA